MGCGRVWYISQTKRSLTMFCVHSRHPKVRAGPPVAVRWTINFALDGVQTSHGVKIICDLYLFARTQQSP